MLDSEKKTNTKLQTAEMQFLRSAKVCTRLDRIRNENTRKELGVFSMNNRRRKYRQDWLEHVGRIGGGRVPKQPLWRRPKGRRDPARSRRRLTSDNPEQAIGLILEL
jgi:hypothetical protein